MSDKENNNNNNNNNNNKNKNDNRCRKAYTCHVKEKINVDHMFTLTKSKRYGGWAGVRNKESKIDHTFTNLMHHKIGQWYTRAHQH
jgi:hypothetical protein